MNDEMENWLNSSFGGFPHGGQGNPSGITPRMFSIRRGAGSGMGGVKSVGTAQLPAMTGGMPSGGFNRAPVTMPKVPVSLGNGAFERGQGFGGVRPLMKY